MSNYIPKQVIIEATSRCNLKCKLCPNIEDTDKKDMSFSLFTSIIDRIDFKTTVIPWMNGEPLLHPYYHEMLSYLERKDLPYYVTTNGTLYRNDVFDQFLKKDSNCYQVIFSLDGVPYDKSRSIEIARPGTNRTTVLEHINQFLREKQNHRPELDVAIKICNRGQDYEEIEDYIKWGLFGLGVDYVCVGRDLTGENPISMRYAPCQYFEHNFMVIRADGSVVMCAYNLNAVNDPAFKMGTVDNETSLLDVYNNDPFAGRRKMQNNGIYAKPCDTCKFPYTGLGFEGVISFREEQYRNKAIYYHQDYYNQFFSLKLKTKDRSYYRRSKGT